MTERENFYTRLVRDEFGIEKVRLFRKWLHYFWIYNTHFSRFRNSDVRIVEFGVDHGGSLQMWKHYFGKKCHIFGIDIQEECKAAEEEQIDILIGDQSSKQFLHDIVKKIGRVDIVIDDGGHTMAQQINTFEVMYPLVSAIGVYVVEDTHTSYWHEYNGGYKNKKSFIEYSKSFIDMLHAWHSESKDLYPTEFTKTTNSIHFYDSVLVLEKRPVTAPVQFTNDGVELPTITDKNIKLLAYCLNKHEEDELT